MQLNDVLKLPEKTWTQKNNGVQLVVNTFHKATQGKFNWKQPVNVTDLTGNTMDISFETEYPDSLLNQGHIDKKAIWRLKWWTGRGGQNISGYPEIQLNEAGQPEKWQLPPASQTPPQAQQAPQNAPQSTNAPQPATQDKKEPDWDAKDQRNANMNALNNATAYLTTCAQVSNNIASFLSQGKIKQVAAEFAEFIYTNKIGQQPDTQEKCPHCGKPHPECSCTPAF